MVGDESFSSSSETRRELCFGMVRTGVETVPGVNVDKMQRIGKSGASHPTSTGEKLQEVETTEYRSSDILLNIASDSDKNRVLSRISTSKYLYSLVGEGSRALISGNFRLALSKLNEVCDELQKCPTHVFDEFSKYIWFKYAHFISQIEVNNYPDLANALKSLPELKSTLFAEMPTYHYSVAKLLVKFNRFHLAEEEIQRCHNAMVGHDFKKQFWPCTEEVIKEATQEGLENYLQELTTACKGYHVPDASCKFESCISTSSHPYPSRDIFHSDPDFKGYVVLFCQEGCKVHYHPQCWKNLKETFTNLDKLSDKECLGKPCLTPDCKNTDGEQSVIQKIEIFGSDGHIKSQCVQDLGTETKQKEIALKKRQRQISDELKNEKLAAKIKQKNKKGPDHNHTSEVIASSTKMPPPKDNKPLQITGVSNVKQNIPAKERNSKYREMDTLAGQNDFICSYFSMLVNSQGPLSKEKVEEEWGKFYPIFKPMAGLVTKSCGIFNLLKSSSNFVILDDLLCIKDSPKKEADSKGDSTSDIKNIKEIQADPPPAAKSEEPLKPPTKPDSSKQTEPVKTFESVIDVLPVLQRPSDLTSSKANSSNNDWAKENAVLDSEISEIEKELRLTSLLDRTSKSVHNSSELPNTQLLNSPIKDRTKAPDEQAIQSNPQTVNKPFIFFDENRSENKAPPGKILDYQKLAGIPFHKSGENITMMPQRPEGFFFAPPLIRPTPPPLITSIPPQGPTPIRWPVDGLQPQKPMPYGNQEIFKQMMIFPAHGGLDPSFGFQAQNRKDISVQTDEKWEEKGSGDETWVQHMQLAVNELLKKNKDLMHSKEELMRAHENEVEALKNQMQTLRQSYEQYIESLKESIVKNDDDRRRTMALEQRMKLQEQILNSTREELRNKDFDLLEAKRLLGVTILERLESESCKQVTRLVTALASLPCNNKEAEAVGQAMSVWEATGDKATKAKSEFLAACMRHQAKLFDGYGSDTLKDLLIPMIEEPAGICPLDSLTLKLLHDKENTTINEHVRMNQARPSMPAPIGIPPFRNRNTTAALAVSTAAHSAAFIPAPLSPVSLGARPRDSTLGEASLRKWPSSLSVQSSGHSSSGGNPRVLSNFRKLLIELKRCYPSRTEDELCSAIKLTRRKNKNTLSGLTIEKIVGMVGSVLEWWPEPIDGSMGLDKFMGWASDVTPADETFCSVSKAPPSSVWVSGTSSPRREGDKEDCCICLQGMSEPKTELICSHSFHTQCIRTWLSKESVCPICRKFSRMPDEFPTLK